jgi:chromatin remodeling complex protein RSC6
MPRTSKRKDKTSRTEKTSSGKAAAKAAPARKTRSKRSTTSRSKRKQVVEEPVVSDVEETKEEVATETVEESVPEKKVTRKRVQPTRETVLEGFDALVAVVDDEITKRREAATKSNGVKFLRTVNKKVKALRSQAARVMKQRQRTNRKNNNNSGFLKPVKISREMAKFTGWDPKELRSRVDVTKYICKYIKDNDLQNPADRRQIRVQADSKLRKLLGYDASKDDKPLTYYRLQTYMKKHFIKDPPAEA